LFQFPQLLGKHPGGNSGDAPFYFPKPAITITQRVNDR